MEFQSWRLENLISLYRETNPALIYTILCYFNTLGAHPHGLFGERPKSSYKNLLHLIRKSSLSISPITIYGYNLLNQDGTPMRDYVHVAEFIHVHILSINLLLLSSRSDLIFNLGTGIAHGILEVLSMYEEVTGISINLKLAKRRYYAAKSLIANAEYASVILRWKPRNSLSEMIDYHIYYSKFIPQIYAIGYYG